MGIRKRIPRSQKIASSTRLISIEEKLQKASINRENRLSIINNIYSVQLTEEDKKQIELELFSDGVKRAIQQFKDSKRHEKQNKIIL